MQVGNTIELGFGDGDLGDRERRKCVFVRAVERQARLKLLLLPHLKRKHNLSASRALLSVSQRALANRETQHRAQKHPSIGHGVPSLLIWSVYHDLHNKDVAHGTFDDVRLHFSPCGGTFALVGGRWEPPASDGWFG